MLVFYNFLPMILTTVVGIIAFKRLPLAFRLVLLQVILALIAQALGTWWAFTAPKENMNNTWVYNIYVLPDFWVQCLVAGILTNKRVFTFGLNIAVAIHLIVWCINLHMVGSQHLVNWAYLVANIFLMSGYLMLIVQLISAEGGPILKNPVFLLCLSVILYNCCSIPFVAMFNLLNDYYPVLSGKLFTMLELLDMLRLLICGYCFLLYFRKGRVRRQDAY